MAKIRRRTKTQLERIYDMEIEISMSEKRKNLNGYKKEVITEFKEKFKQIPAQDLVADWTDDAQCVKGSTMSLWRGSSSIHFSFITNDDHPLMVEYDWFLANIKKNSTRLNDIETKAKEDSQKHVLAFLKDKSLEAPKLKIGKFQIIK